MLEERLHALITVVNYSPRSILPLPSASPGPIRAEWLPNCIARFFRALASINPTFRAASRNNNFSPSPKLNRGSILWCTGS